MPWEYWSQLSFPEIGDNWLEYTDQAIHCTSAHYCGRVFCILYFYVLRISLVAAQAPSTALWRGWPGQRGESLKAKNCSDTIHSITGKSPKATLKPCISQCCKANGLKHTLKIHSHAKARFAKNPPSTEVLYIAGLNTFHVCKA